MGALTWASPTSTSPITIHHLNITNTPQALINHLYELDKDEVDKGMTYPQEDVGGREGFVDYFFAADFFVGVRRPEPGAEGSVGTAREVEIGIEEARAGREWADCVVGFYYVRCTINIPIPYV
jgi:hypothetical protein